MKFLKNLFKNKSKDLTLEELIYIAGEKGFMLTAFDDSTRGIGKTEALLKLSNDTGHHILTTNHYDYNLKLTQARNMKYDAKILYVSSEKSLKGLKTDSFIVDELTDIKIIKEILRIGRFKIIGGISNIKFMK